MKQVTSFLLVSIMYLGLIAPFGAQIKAQSMQKSIKERFTGKDDGLKFSLSEGTEGAGDRQLPPPIKGEKLSSAETDALYGRMPKMITKDGDDTDFAKRAGSLPPPKTGTKIPVKFPSGDTQAQTIVNSGNLGSLEVVRYTPEGEVGLAPDLSVTFSQPMVAVTSQEDAAKNVPVQLTPTPPGKWRWLGTKTIEFDADQRFPMATEFTARIPAGTRSVTGGVLAKDVTWKFATPPSGLIAKYPEGGDTRRRDEIIFMGFDQKINPSDMIEYVSVTSGGQRIPVRLATEAELNETLKYYVKTSQPGRWMAIRAINPAGGTENALPGDALISVSVRAGAPSAEGPLRTKADQNFSFKTFGAFKFVEGGCGYQGIKSCSPFDNFYAIFSNPIDVEGFDASMVKVSPEIPGMTVYPGGTGFTIQGVKKGKTSYTVEISGELKDEFGQKLGEGKKFVVKTGSAPSSVYSSGGAMITLDPSSRVPSYSVYSTNQKALKAKIYRVSPSDWNAYADYYARQNYGDGVKRQIPGTLLADKILPVKNFPDEIVETSIDLSQWMKGGLGNLILQIEPTTKRSKDDRTQLLVWVQSTKIGLDAFVDNKELVGFATDLASGAALSGVKMSIMPNGAKLSSAASGVAKEKGFADSILDWVSSFVSSDNGTSIESNGDAVDSESIAPSQSDTTSQNGILRLPLPEKAPKSRNLLIAQKGNDIAFLPEATENYWEESGSWYRHPLSDSYSWFVFDDRGMYRPNEEISIKGYIRTRTAGTTGDITKLPSFSMPINYSINDSRGNEIGKGTAKLNAFGAFDFKFKLPDNANLGNASVNISFADPVNKGAVTSTNHQFQIQEFRRPEFEVSSKVVSPAPFFVGGSANVEVEAKYYAGGSLANAEVNWNVTATPTNYTPPNRDDYVFGKWFPWWRNENSDGDGLISQSFKGVTGADGKHNLKIDFESVSPPRPYLISASSSVQDVNRQTWSSSTSLMVHPSDLYVGLKSKRNFVQKGEKIEIASIVTNLDGKLVSGKKVEITATLTDWAFEKGKWVEKTMDEQSCNVTSSESEQNCSFTAKGGGQYAINALVMDDRERFNQTEMTVWVAGGKVVPNREVAKEEIQIIPSGKEFKPGDTAELLVIAPFAPAEGVLTLRRDGLVSTERFSIKDSSAILRIPIKEEYLPNIYAQVDLVGAAVRTDDAGEPQPKLPKRPAFASGSINLSVSKASRRLDVTASPDEATLDPGGSTNLKIDVKDYRGEPVGNTELAVVVVDESVLALSNYQLADPVSIFYADRGDGVNSYYSREQILLSSPQNLINGANISAPPAPPANVEGLTMLARGVGFGSGEGRGDGAGEFRSMKSMSNVDAVADIKESQLGEPAPAIELRKNFDALAVFAPHVTTDSSGRATVPVKLPDNLTRYRVMVVSADQDNRFGKGESAITARQPLMVRPSAPRFMNFGDRIELPVVVQNQSDQDMTVDVAVRAMNATLTDGGGRKVIVKANDRVELLFPVAAEKAGTARFQFAVSSGKYSDAAEIQLPVWTPATTEAFATYGTTDQNGAIIQPVQAPTDVYPQFGGLELTTSSTQMQELTDAFIYLYRYPFECTEQISSRMLSIAAMQDVLAAFKSADMPSKAELKASFAKDMKILQARQNPNGYFGLWRRDGERWKYPFITVHTAHALIEAKSKGYDVPQVMLDRVKPYLKDIEKYYDNEYYTPQVRWSTSAYALYVRSLMGDNDEAKAKKILSEAGVKKMSFESLGWLLSVFVAGKSSQAEANLITRFLLNQSTETAATAQFNTNYGDGEFLIMYSSRRTDAVILDALLRLKAKQSAMPSKADEGQVPVGKERDTEKSASSALEAKGDSASVAIKAVSANTNLRGPSAPAEEEIAQKDSPADVSDLIPKIVRGLLDHRTKGRWSSTQENVFVLLALDEYFRSYENVTPNFVNQVWLGNAYAGEQKFVGRSVDSQQLEIPMSYLVSQGGAADLIMNKQGAGRLYYRIGMKYAPKNLNLKPAEYGFTVLRTYEAIDDPSDVTRSADGKWQIKAGARVRVKLSMVAEARRYHVALVDPLPAGLEILNPELSVTEAIPNDKNSLSVTPRAGKGLGADWYWQQNWFEHQNFRDERAEAFASILYGGIYNYSYVARATTPGEFVVPPAKAEEMYHPEVFGRTGTDFVSVK